MYVANEKFNKESAERAVQRGDVDAVVFGSLFIANPDLPARFAETVELNAPNPASFFARS